MRAGEWNFTPLLRGNKWILTIPAHIDCLDMLKNWLDFGNLDFIFKVTWWLRWLENSLSAPYLLNKWMDFYQTCTSILLRHGKNWLDFDDLDPIFKVTGMLRFLENDLFARCIQNEQMDFDLTCTSTLFWHGKELIRFWWPWPQFQGHRRAQIVGKWLFCTLSPEWMDGFWPNLYSYIVETGTRTD